MKTALGYLFLAFGATIAGLLIFSIIYASTGHLASLLSMQHYTPTEWTQIVIFWLFHITIMVPLVYYGFKWIRREQDYPSPPTGGLS